METAFPGLIDGDFDAYLPARASSNSFVRPRIAVKEKLQSVLQGVLPIAKAQGLALEIGASDERPSVWNGRSVTEQWVYLWRDRDERLALERAFASELTLGGGLNEPPPWRRHPTLALRLDHAGIEVLVGLFREARGDLLHLRRQLEQGSSRSALLAQLSTLGAPFVWDSPGSPARALETVDESALREALTGVESDGASVRIRARMERAEAVQAGAALAEKLQALAVAALALYARLAWQPDRDETRVGDEIARELAARESHTRELAEREAAWQANHDAELERQRVRAFDQSHARPAAPPPTPRPAEPTRRPPRDSRPDAPRQGPVQSAPRPAAAARPAPPPSTAPKLELVDAPIVLGARVRVLRGPFVGKEGTVLELDPHGNAKVQFGPVATRIESGFLSRLG